MSANTSAVKGISAPPLKPRFLKSKGFRQRANQIISTVLIFIGAGMIMVPAIWMFSTSLKTRFTVTTLPPEWIPEEPVQVDVDGEKLFLYDVEINGKMMTLAAKKLDPVKSVFVVPGNSNEVYYAPADLATRHKIYKIHWENYLEVWNFASTPFAMYMKNTVVYALVAVLGEVISCSLVAYGFARLRSPGKSFLFMLVLATLMVPGEVTIIPTFVMFTRYIPDFLNSILGTHIVLADTWWPLMLPKFFGSAYLIFLIRQFYMGIPIDYDDAARIDGCSYFQTWWRIIIPMSQPVLIAVAILSFQYHWAQDYMTPLIYLNSTLKQPVTVGLANFQASYGGTPWHLMMAGSIIAVSPLVLIFFALNRYFLQGVVVNGVKG